MAPSNNNIITLQLLEALMSPSNDIRGQAETVYNSITPITRRVEGLMESLMDFVSSLASASASMQPQQSSSTAATLAIFLSVLLRRDILKIDQTSLLEQLVDPLLQCFLEMQSDGLPHRQQVQNGIGHCLAEVCASLSVLPVVVAAAASVAVDNNDTHVVAGEMSLSATNAVTKIAQRIEPMISSNDNGNGSTCSLFSALSLLSMVADRAPVAYTKVVTTSQVSQIIHLVVMQSQQQSQSPHAHQSWRLLETCFKLVVQSAIATTIEEVSVVPTQPNVEDLRVDDDQTMLSAARQVGQQTLPTLIQWYMSMVSDRQQLHNNGGDYPCQCLQHLSHAALTVPSLLVGSSCRDASVLSDLVDMVCNIITAVNTNDNDNDSSSPSSGLSLEAIQVVSNLCSVPDVRHKILMNRPDMVNQICQNTVQVCIRYMVPRDSDQEEKESEELIDFIGEPANLLDFSSEAGGGAAASNIERISIAQDLLESLLSSLAGPALSVALPLAQELLSYNNNLDAASNSSWTNIWTALSVIETAVVAAPHALAPHAHELIQAACSHADSAASASSAGGAAAVVQYQALRLLATLCEVPVESVTHHIRSAQFSRPVLEQFATALTSPVTKLCSMGSTGIISYCQSGNSDDTSGEDDGISLKGSLTPYLGHLLQALINGPLSITGTDMGRIAIRVRAMDATACLAAACVASDDSYDDGGDGVMFAPFYQIVMPGLMATARLPQPDLATSALRSLAIVGSAVGVELFQTDAKQVMSWILSYLSSSSSSEGGVSTEEVLTATARIASVLKDEFSPYISSLLPTIIRIAKECNDVSILEGNESGVLSRLGNGPQGGESMTVALPGKGYTKLTINTFKIQEKASNNRVLYELAKATGALLGPHVQTLLDAVIPLINFPYSSDVRSTAAQATSALFESACSYGADVCDGDMQCPRHYLPILSEAISRQISQEDSADKEALYGSADSLSEIFYITHDKYKQFRSMILGEFSLKNAQEVVERCIKTLVNCLNRRSTLTRMLQGALTGQDEKEEFEAQLQSEDGLLTPLTDSTGYLLKFFGQSFLPLFEQYLVPVLSRYISSTADARASVAAFCLFDDCIEYCGSAAAAKYSPLLLPGVVKVLQDLESNEIDLVQASVYGVAQMARNAPPPLLASSIHTLVSQLLVLTKGNKEDAPTGPYLYEISISALSSLVLWGPFSNLKGLNVTSIQQSFLSSLPIQQNDDEAKICHTQLCSLIRNGSINTQEEAFRLTQIIAAILSDVEGGEDVASQDTCSQLMSTLHQLQHGNPQMVQKAYAGLDARMQSVVGSILQGGAVNSYANIVTPEKY